MPLSSYCGNVVKYHTSNCDVTCPIWSDPEPTQTLKPRLQNAYCHLHLGPCSAVRQWCNLPQNPQVLMFQQTDQPFQQPVQQQASQPFSQQFQPKQPVVQAEPLDKCAVADYEQIQCGPPGISGAECDASTVALMDSSVTMGRQEDSGYVYENRMTSSYEVGVGPLGSITRDSHFELQQFLVKHQYSSSGDEAYTSYYSDADYPVTKVLREPVYVEVRILERTNPNIVLMLGRCWATSTPSPLSLPQWDLLVDGSTSTVVQQCAIPLLAHVSKAAVGKEEMRMSRPSPVGKRVSSGEVNLVIKLTSGFNSHFNNMLVNSFLSGFNRQFNNKLLPQQFQPKQPVAQAEPLDKCAVADYELIQCGPPVTVQCIRDGQFVVVGARDVTLPRLSLSSVRLLGGNDSPCSPVGSTPSFAIYQFPVTACGTSMMEDSGYVVYENRMTSSYEVGIGPLGSITRDSHFEYSATSVEALVVEVNTVPPPPPVAAPGPLRVELRLANGQCITKGCAEVTKVLREPVYVEVRILERTDPNIVLMLGRCWATSTPSPLPQWDLLVDGCPYQDDRYLTTLVPVAGSSGLQFPTHYKHFVVKMFTFVDPASLAPLQETILIHCSTAVCYPSSGSCERRCSRKRRDADIKTISSGQTVVSSEVNLVM
ncbi:Zona pellucida sperm-binding protein 4 [Anabarilius grahami]|uniref:Zona pellucida sperm-binding protein 4 n=1 Tax=Anabarilius grahami TaxID=495550 RepID=A0A3N0YWI0_ANAGA|nr:Zona pellucida sperm-binding protein 4 [Anabarilius grahami]